MGIKVLFKELKAVTMDLRGISVTFLAPFFFRIIPGFEGSIFPAVILFYIVIGLFLSRLDRNSIRAGLGQFPIKVRDHVTGMFLFQATASLIAVLLSFIFMKITGPENYMQSLLPKTFGIVLCMMGILSLASLWLRPEITRVLSIIIVIAVINMLILSADEGTIFMPFISELGAVIVGFSCWGLFLILGLIFPPRF
ncbi:MAG: hypothetical protein QM308_04365 [Bacillota bacterium]|nr:hypothetical protein [Bacillota bacterium]